ncbi:MAG TPA: sialidase [Thermoanaerobaculia bacterium]|nr:sialidase [Thermoanaerobaculia bacterium]
MKRITAVFWVLAAVLAVPVFGRAPAPEASDPAETPARPKRAFPEEAKKTVSAQPEEEEKPTPEEAEAEKKAGPFANLKFRFIGPPGNRVSAVVGVPGDPNVYYAGAASGGVWKSIDGGGHWKPVFDKEDAQSIGAIAIAPSDPNVVWVGTGETFIRSNVSLGDGVYKSTDAGKTWKHMGLEKTGRIGRVIIDPHDPETVFVAALGTCYGPQPERGVFRTKNGGKTWERVLFVDENTGASDLAMDPTNPRILFAGTWQIDIKTWGRKSGGPGSGVFVSRDGGTTWKRIKKHGLPDPPLGKIAVAVAASDPDRVYALIETGDKGSLWRSDDGGKEWKLVNRSRLLNERPHYYTRMLVMPDNANEVYFPSNSMGVTYDGGETADQVDWAGDNHDMWADPKDPSRMMIGSDIGVVISTTRGKKWSWTRLPIAQMYHVATDTRIPYDVYGQMQDGGSMRGPSRNPGGEGIPPALWTTTAGCETGWNTPDPVDPNVVWGGCYAGVVERWDARTGMSRSVSVWPERTMGANAGEVKLRMNWTFPIAISPHDHDTVYVGSQYVHETTDGGVHWKTISPDLTTNDPSMMGDSGGLTVDNLSVEYAGVVFSIAESPLSKGEIWAGTNDGVVQVTRDGGAHWTKVTPPKAMLPPKGTVESVEPSRFEKGTCYVSVDLHQVDDFDPFLFKTTDWGKTWKRIAGNIPKSPLSYVHVVREDPFRKGMLYAGTENGLWVSFDDGGRWIPLQGKLPHAPVYWLTVEPRFRDLVVATYGRGFWILDDVTALEKWDEPKKPEADVALFPTVPAYRFRAVSQPAYAPVGAARGKNGPDGALITYWMKKEVPKPKKKDDGEFELPEKEKPPLVAIRIYDAAGNKVRSLRGSNEKGFNRVDWDLRYDPVREVRLRATPPGNRHVREEKRFVGRDRRPVLYYGIEEAGQGPLVPPGTYTVKLDVEGSQYATTVEVRKDPNSAGTEADVEEGTKFALAIWRDTNAAAEMINRLEWGQLQIERLRKMVHAENGDASLLDQTAALAKKMASIEADLLQPTISEEDQKSFRGPLGLYLKLIWLNAEASTGAADVSGNADFGPTQPERDVFALLDGRLNETRKEFDDVFGTDVPAFNRTMEGKGIGAIMPVEEVLPEFPPAKEKKEED